MKRWIRGPLRAWRLVGLTLALGAILLAAPHCVAWWIANSNCGYSRHTVISKDGRLEAIVAEKCCSWGCRDQIGLRQKSPFGGSEVSVFIYDPT